MMLSGTGRPTAADPYDEQGALALPTAPVFRGQREKGTGTTLTKNAYGYQQHRGVWGKRHATGRRYSDGMGPMLSTRPASRQAQSDLTDLNLALKFDKMGSQSVSRQPKERSQQSHARTTDRSGKRHDGGATGEKTAAERVCADTSTQAFYHYVHVSMQHSVCDTFLSRNKETSTVGIGTSGSRDSYLTTVVFLRYYCCAIMERIVTVSWRRAWARRCSSFIPSMSN